jgi:hypothetical protein
MTEGCPRKTMALPTAPVAVLTGTTNPLVNPGPNEPPTYTVLPSGVITAVKFSPWCGATRIAGRAVLVAVRIGVTAVKPTA